MAKPRPLDLRIVPQAKTTCILTAATCVKGFKSFRGLKTNQLGRKIGGIEIKASFALAEASVIPNRLRTPARPLSLCAPPRCEIILILVSSIVLTKSLRHAMPDPRLNYAVFKSTALISGSTTLISGTTTSDFISGLTRPGQTISSAYAV